MKNLNHIIKKANITPFERVVALVQNDAHKEKTGKDILSGSELYTLTEGWDAETKEAKEYNRYINMVRLEGSMRIDARTFSHLAELTLLRNQRLLTYFMSNSKKLEGTNKNEVRGMTKEEGIRFTTERTYLEYSQTLHSFTFDNLPREAQDDLSVLDEWIASSKRYMEDEVLLYEMLKYGMLGEKDKNTLVNCIFSRMHDDGIRKVRQGTEKDGYLLGSYFAELPIDEVIFRIAENAGILYKDREEEELLKDIEDYTKGKKTTMERLIRDKLNAWLDDGLFTTNFTPLFASDHFNTWSGTTKMSHKELFSIWYVELQKSKQYFESLFSSGKLKKQETEITILGETTTVEILTGKSLYACQEDANFVKEYKKQVDMLLPFSNIVLFIEKYANPNMHYTSLCEFKKLAMKADDIFDANFIEQYDNHISSYKEEVELLNHDLRKLTDMATEHLYADGEIEFRYSIHITDGKFGVQLEENGDTANIVKKYIEEFKTVMKQ